MASSLTSKSDVADGYRRVAAGWRKWREPFKVAGAPLTEAMLAQSGVRPGMRVLDIACGVGEPSHRLASEVAATGFVVAIDLVPEMVSFASTMSATAGQTNLGYAVADGEALPFAGQSFDAVTCRGAIMHFPTPQAALSEAWRVLRPGGRAVFSALGAAGDTPAFLATIAVIQRYLAPSPPSANDTDFYQFAVPGTFSSLLRSAGFGKIEEVALTAACPWPGDAEHFWGALRDHGWNFARLFENVPLKFRDQAAAEAVTALRQYEKNGTLHLTAPVIIASGAR